MRKVAQHASTVSIVRLCWSPSGKFLVSADDSGRLIAKRLEPPSLTNDHWKVFPVFDIRVDESLEHLLFSANEDYVLVAGPTRASIWTLRGKEKAREIANRKYPFRKEGFCQSTQAKPPAQSVLN